MIDAKQIYATILVSITAVTKVRGVAIPAYLLDEMARNAAQAVIIGLPVENK